ncbi:MAG TPA: L,D-transpeptidase family protein [Steroidobacteraceae bacterium]|nr:L,D-transpeptidase family protein [Steroidobacteraceae bacterium]
MKGLRHGVWAGLAAALCVQAPLQAETFDSGRSANSASTQLPVASRVVVYKSQRRMDLMRGEEVLRSYKVALGLMPAGHKEKVGDFRTPEGRYQLTRRNPRSDFFLSIQVSYPNEQDMKRAKANGWDPGGSIMIHGLPNRLKRDPGYYTRDWTDGCIAVSNSDMVEIWLLTNNNTPIDILP